MIGSIAPYHILTTMSNFMLGVYLGSASRNLMSNIYKKIYLTKGKMCGSPLRGLPVGLVFGGSQCGDAILDCCIFNGCQFHIQFSHHNFIRCDFNSLGFFHQENSQRCIALRFIGTRSLAFNDCHVALFCQYTLYLSKGKVCDCESLLGFHQAGGGSGQVNYE